MPKSEIQTKIDAGIVKAIELLQLGGELQANEDDPYFLHGFNVGLARHHKGPYKNFDKETINELLYKIIINNETN